MIIPNFFINFLKNKNDSALSKFLHNTNCNNNTLRRLFIRAVKNDLPADSDKL